MNNQILVFKITRARGWYWVEVNEIDYRISKTLREAKGFIRAYAGMTGGRIFSVTKEISI